MPTRLDCIATFLAMLEMCRLQRVVIFQRKRLGEIRIALVAEEARPEGEPDELATDEVVTEEEG